MCLSLKDAARLYIREGSSSSLDISCIIHIHQENEAYFSLLGASRISHKISPAALLIIHFEEDEKRGPEVAHEFGCELFKRSVEEI